LLECEGRLGTIRLQQPPYFCAKPLNCAEFVQTCLELPHPKRAIPCATATFPGLIQPKHPAPWGASQVEKGKNVKLIIAAIKPFKLEEVREALTGIGVRGMMVTEIKGFGSQSGHTEIYRGAEYAVNFVPKVRLEIVVADGLSDQVVATIQKTAKTDKIGDGKIFVLDVEHAVRVRTGETDDDAL
jgi:nitrogen regulatory protein P-II 1